MNIVIVEDESLTAEDLAATIKSASRNVSSITILHSVRQAVSYFEQHYHPDLIFSDIRLGDGLSFEIFQKTTVNVPVIFCTAYDEYALSAFKANGIHYILKPFSKKSVDEALTKYESLRNNFSHSHTKLESIINLLTSVSPQPEKSILVYFKEKILPIRLSEILLFSSENEYSFVYKFTKEKYLVNKSLEELERMAGHDFFRVNRKYLVSRKGIKEASAYFHRKLILTLTNPIETSVPITVSKARNKEFLQWLSGEQ